MNLEVNQNRQVKTATEYCARVADGTHSSPKQTAIGKPLITSRHLKSGQIDFANAYKISELDFEEINRRSKVDQWDVLITMIGTVGEVCLVKDSRAEFAIKNVGLYKPRNKLDGQWLYYYLRSQLAQGEIKARTRGTTQGYISLAELRQFPILEPKDAEEKRQIVEILSSLDDKIELNRRMNATLEAMARALFKAWFVDFEPVHANKENRPSTSASPEIAKLFPSDFENGIPKGWRFVKLEELVDTISVTHKFPNEEIIFLNTSDISEGYVLTHQHSPVEGLPGQAKKSIRKHDILYSEIRPGNRRYAYVDFDADDYVVSTKLMVLRAKGSVDPVLLFYFLKSDEVVNHLQMLAETRSGTFPQITFDQLKRLQMLLPSDQILEQYTTYLRSIFEKSNLNVRENQKLAEIRNSLLPRLISGRLRVEL